MPLKPLIPDIIDAGVDMLNHIEVKAGMDPVALKAEFGEDYPVRAAAGIGGVVAGIIIDPASGDMLAASDGGPEGVSGLPAYR